MPRGGTKKVGGRGGQVERSRAAPRYKVFISHSSHDTWIAGMIAEKVAGLGAEPWLDTMGLEGGDDTLEAIREGISACDEGVVLVSRHSLESQWVSFEIGAIWGQRKRVTPILVYVDADVMKPLKGVKSVALNDLDSFLKQLKSRVEKWQK